jgi:hypothetical protein
MVAPTPEPLPKWWLVRIVAETPREDVDIDMGDGANHLWHLRHPAALQVHWHLH